jgi:RHS repeat-associated protein
LSATYAYQRFNRLTSTATASYSYDANGNLISKSDTSGTTQYAWDFENRLRQVTLPNGLTVAYKYDALGRRIQRTPSTGISTNFVYDGQDVVKDINSDGSTVDYLNGPGVDNKLRLTDSRLTASGPLYFLQDQVGSTTGFTNSLGAAVSQIRYDSFGNPATAPNLTRYVYTGREFDSDTGLYYYRARWYDAKVGRFISEDPIGFGGGVNQFRYVGNNPQNATDPSGLYNEDVHYYLTYFIATRFSCLNGNEARLIADADQSTDENPDTKPFPGLSITQASQNNDYHAFNLWVNSRMGELRAAAVCKDHNYVGMGRYLHFLQDTYSHSGFQSSMYGQFGFNGVDFPVIGGFVVDNTNWHPEKSDEMARNTFFAIYEFARKKDCKCTFADIGTWWPQVAAFLNTSNSDQIGKRRILDVSLR